MNKILLVLTTIMLLSVMGTTSTAKYTIDSDKVLNISGVRTFPVFLLSAYNGVDKTGESNMSKVLTDFDGEVYGGSFGNIYGRGARNDSLLNQYENLNKGFTLWYSNSNDVATWGSYINSPSFFAFHIQDEGKLATSTYITQYKYAKSRFPDKLVFLNHCCSDAVNVIQSGFKEYSQTGANQVTDILSWDTYSFRNNSWYAYKNQRQNQVYGYEHMVFSDWFKGQYGQKYSSVGIPVWAMIQTQSEAYLHEPKMKELKANTYVAITMNVMGISYYIYNPEVSFKANGLQSNQTLFNYTRQLSREIKSINNILILPTKEYSWQYDKPVSPRNVTFSPNPTVTLTADTNGAQYTFDKLNYRLMQNITSGKTYLIVVNKDSNTTSNIIINISGLSGSMTATTLGLETTGSQAHSRKLSVTNGVFIDSFDGYAVHIYEITSSNSAPTITSWGNTKTNNNLRSLTINTSEYVTFSAIANQTIKTWTWFNDGNSTGNNQSAYNTSFSTGGEKTISVNATNTNGTSNTIKWTIYVIPTANTDPKIGIGGVPFSRYNSNFTHAVVNKGDDKVTVGLFADNCNDGTSDWGYNAWTCSNGYLIPTSPLTRTESWQNLSEYTDVTLFLKANESVISLWDATLRNLKSRDSIYKRYYYVQNTTNMMIHIYSGWTILNITAWNRNANTDYYYIFDIAGTTLSSHVSNISFSDAKNNIKLTGMDSTYSSGDYLELSGTNVKFDDIRLIEHNRFSGSIAVHYDAGANNQSNSVIINTTTPENTNYTISYRQKYTGSWIPIGGAYTGNQTISITGTKYQDTEINITLFGNGTSFPDIETIEFIREQAASNNVYPRYDVDGNGIVDMDDLTLVGQYFNEIVSIPFPRYDVNMDGLVNIDDITIVGQHFGEKF